MGIFIPPHKVLDSNSPRQHRYIRHSTFLLELHMPPLSWVHRDIYLLQGLAVSPISLLLQMTTLFILHIIVALEVNYMHTWTTIKNGFPVAIS